MRPARGRVELKYSVPEGVAVRVLDIARTFLDPEQYAEGGRQRVTSLYLETPSLTFLRWHKARAADRFKLRVRRYGDHSASVLFAELKRKTNDLVHKRRARFPVEVLDAVIDGARLSHMPLAPGDEGDMAEFIRQRLVFGARPSVLITCVRESWRGSKTEPENAVTVDRELTCQPADRADVIGGGTWSPIRLPRQSRRDDVLLELKYGTQPAAWMTPLIARLAPSRVSFSKYVAAMSLLRPWETC
ncbi:MAG: polyphosphate polymerase domain-containing protein [Vicinamibacterales bacterium]